MVGSGGYDRHLRAARRAYRRRRDAVLAALRRHLPQARVTGIAAGLHLLVELPATVDDRVVAERAAAAAWRRGHCPRCGRMAAGPGRGPGHPAWWSATAVTLRTNWPPPSPDWLTSRARRRPVEQPPGRRR